MEPKRFFAENSQRAFRMVRESLGPEAIIFSNRTLADGVEIIAGDEECLPTEPAPDEPIIFPAFEPSQESLWDEPIGPVSHDSTEEYSELKKLLVSELAAVKIGHWAKFDEAKYALFQYFLNLGFHANHLSKLISVLDDSSTFEESKKDILQEIEFSLNVPPLKGSEVESLEGIIMLHGLSGAGKTTSMAKIATQSVAAHGKENVVLVCADNKRLGAYQQLLGYGKILEIPVLRVRRESELEEILQALNNKKVVLVDQPGLTPDELPSIELTPAFQCNLADIHHFLVVAASTQGTVLNRLLGAAWSTRLSGVIVTKLDEAVLLGELISCLIQNYSPVTYMSAGQDIQTDLELFNPSEVVEKSVLLAEKYRYSEGDAISSAVKTLLHQQLEFLH
ncbi:MAG: hypothetical protein KTR35_17120 [Gammaproteobacteria bacterium]|nr:hypothetical protein [Gammaproteobacteria bacterium]